MKLALIVKEGPNKGLEFTATEAGVYCIGRAHDVHLRLSNDQFVSRNHCELKLTSEGLVLTDLDSRHGVFVNQQRIVEKYQLRNGDLLVVGKSQISVAIDGVDEPTALDEPDEGVQGFQVIREMMRNGDRTISLAFSIELGTPVLLHRMDLKFANETEKGRLEARLLREAGITSGLNHCPGILRFRQQGISGDSLWFATEYIDAKPMSQMVNKEHKLRANEALNILAQCAETLNCVHHFGVIHRNLQPDSFWIYQNIRQIQTYLVDLASAKWLSNTELIPITTSSGLSFQNNHFAAPEIFSDYRTADKCSDIYSLGAIFYFLLSGTSPYEDVDEAGLISAILTEPPKPLPPETDQTATEIIRRAMAYHPEDRFDSMQSFLQAILAARETHTSLNSTNRKFTSENAAREPILFELTILSGESGWKQRVTRADLDLRGETEEFQPPFSRQDWAALYKALRTQVGVALPASEFSVEQWQILFKYGVAKELAVNAGDPPRQILLPTLTADIGKKLFEAILPANSRARVAFISTLARAQRERQSLQFRLVFPPDRSEVAMYPWELIHDGAHLIRVGQVDLIRDVTFGKAFSALNLEPPLRMLFVASRPENQLALPELAEQQAVLNGLRASGKIANVSLDVLTPPDYETFSRAISKGDYQIVHFDGHGFFGNVCPSCGTHYTPLAQYCEKDKFSFMGSRPQGYLIFEDKNHQSQYVSAQTLQGIFGPSRVQLVTLSACYSGRISDENIFSGAGPSLIQVGVPMVVAMQQPILVDDAVCFIRQFYEALVESQDPAEAVRQGRQQLQNVKSNPEALVYPNPVR